jgi:hypothetical protein
VDTAIKTKQRKPLEHHRALARAVAKYAAAKDRKGEVAGELANLGTVLLERADVRSWHLLVAIATFP